MMPTLQLTPAAAARIYEGPRFHRSRSPAENRRIIRDTIRKFKDHPSPAVRYMGCILEAITKLKPHPAAAAALCCCLLSGCSVVTYDRTFPELAWYWSKDAKAQRADRAQIGEWDQQQQTNSVPP